MFAAIRYPGVRVSVALRGFLRCFRELTPSAPEKQRQTLLPETLQQHVTINPFELGDGTQDAAKSSDTKNRVIGDSEAMVLRIFGLENDVATLLVDYAVSPNRGKVPELRAAHSDPSAISCAGENLVAHHM